MGANMKSKLRAALIATGCTLALVGVANADPIETVLLPPIYSIQVSVGAQVVLDTRPGTYDDLSPLPYEGQVSVLPGDPSPHLDASARITGCTSTFCAQVYSSVQMQYPMMLLGPSGTTAPVLIDGKLSVLESGGATAFAQIFLSQVSYSRTTQSNVFEPSHDISIHDTILMPV